MVSDVRLSGANPDLPSNFDPEVAFAALGGIIQALRASYGFRRLGINSMRDGRFVAEGWWGEDEAGSGQGADAKEALRALVSVKAARKCSR